MNKQVIATVAALLALTGTLLADEPVPETLGEFLYQTRTGVVVTVDVAADAVRCLAAMPYGRGYGAKIEKTGAGLLIVQNIRNFPGKFYLNAGAIRLGDVAKPAGETELCDIQHLVIADDTEIEVAAGKTARVAIENFTARFKKTGDGVLEVVNTENKKLANAQLKGGLIRYVNEPTVESAAQLAAGPSLHLDANDTDSFEFSSGTTVSKWYDAKGVNYAGKADGSPTFYEGVYENPTTHAKLNAVSFGGFRSVARATLHEAVHGVRVAYVVAARGAAGGKTGVLLGVAPAYCLTPATSPDNSNDICDFKYHNDSSGWPTHPFRADNANYTVRFLNGTAVGEVNYYYDSATGDVHTAGTTYAQFVPASANTNDFYLYEVKLSAGAHVSALAGWGQNYLQSGGWRYGEILLYERELTDRERLATRNYLAKKWLGRTDEQLAELPAAPADPDPFLAPEYEYADGETMAIGTGDVFGIGNLQGGGVLTKAGAGTLAVKDVTECDGTIAVSGGTLKLTGVLPPYEPAMPTAVPVARFDASDAASVITNASGKVLAWKSQYGDITATNRENSAKNFPVSEALGGRRYIDMENGKGMKFVDSEGTWIDVENIASALWIHGFDNGGGFLLGATTGDQNRFHRGPSGYADGAKATDALIFNANQCDCARQSEFYQDFERRSASNAFSPVTNPSQCTDNSGPGTGWHFIGYRANMSQLSTSAAGGFAFCSNVAGRGIRAHMAEVVLYTNQLTRAEVLSAGVYLKMKWGLEPDWVRSTVNGLAVSLASGTTLDLGGTNQYLKAFSGVGAVVNGTLAVKELSLDATKTLSVDGLDLSQMTVVSLENAASITAGEYTLVSATAISGTLDGIEITGLGNVPQTLEATVAIVGNAIILTAVQKTALRDLTPADGSSVDVPEDVTTAVRFVNGAGSFTKTGAGTLAIRDVVGYDGTVNVAAGTLKVTGAQPPMEPVMPDEESAKCVLHFDAADLSTFDISNVSSRAYIKEWRSKTANGWKAVPRQPSYAENSDRARLEADIGLGGDLSVRMQNNGSRGMAFYDAEMNRVGLTNIASVIWIIGSQEGGGFLFGQESQYGMAKASDGWHRGPSAYGIGSSHAGDALCLSSAFDGFRTAEFYVNDKRLCDDGNWAGGKTTDTPGNYGLTGGWDYLSMRTRTYYQDKLAADGFAFHTQDAYNRCGCQRLAEVLVYERQLTEAEERAASVYLRAKWGLENWQRSQTNDFAVVVGADATLDLGGTNQYLKAVGGEGAVVNGDLRAESVVIDPTATGALSVSGTLQLDGGAVLDLSGLASALANLPIERTVLSAAAISGGDRRLAVSGTEGLPENVRVKVFVKGNDVVLKMNTTPGMLLFVR